MIKEVYRNQVDLLLRVLPYVAKEEIFALKGGTAMNFFIRNLPSLSVDINLTYLPIDSREEALKDIQEGLARIKNDIEKYQKDINVTTVTLRGESDVKLNCQCNNAQL